jgi:penicillin-binding protein 1A
LHSFPRWAALIVIVMLSSVAVGGVAIAIYSGWLFHNMPDASEIADYRPPTATRVYAWDGTLIGEISTERRIFVPFDQIPPHLWQAYVAAEDHNFFHHQGLDVQGLGRALFKNIGNVIRGRRLEGGSTITQQVAKNVLLSSEQTLGRKLQEALLAARLEQLLTKEQILELYLNEIWLGYRSYGVGAAAYNYFGASINQLTLAQSAYLAALAKGPEQYHPVRNHDAAVRRRNAILDDMVELRYITRAQAEEAKLEPLTVQSAPARARYRDADFFMEEVRRRAVQTFGHRQVYEGGYYMRTTLDPRLQTAARIALMDGLEAYDRRHGWRGAWGHVNIAPGWQRSAASRSPPSERRAWRTAVVTAVEGSTVRVEQTDGSSGTLLAADVAWSNGGPRLTVGDLIFVEPVSSSDGSYHLRQVPAVNGAIVVLEPRSGRTLAMVGGYSFSLSNFNRATQALRQPGSAIKPVVYATALNSAGGEWTPMSQISDAPFDMNGYRPGNYERSYGGRMYLRRALALSRNMVAVRLAAEVGMNEVSRMAVAMGVTDHMEPILSMALGAGETTPFRLAGAYCTFLNGGHHVTPHLIELVQDRNGRSILRADQRQCPTCDAAFNGSASPMLPQGGQQLLDPITAYQMESLMTSVVQNGTASAARVLNRPIGGKTGTTNDYRSAWFVGFTPQMVVATFVGFDDNRSLGHGETGGNVALPIFINFMRSALQGLPVVDFEAPPNAVFVNVGGVREAFRPGSEVPFELPHITTVSAPRAAPPRAPRPTQQQGPAPTAPPPQQTQPTRPPDEMQGLY